MSLNEVLAMDFIMYRRMQRQLDILEAEERLILQRQLDNHIKVTNKDLVKKFGDIYKEFEDVVFSDIKIVKKDPSKIDTDTAKALWKNTLAKLKK